VSRGVWLLVGALAASAALVTIYLGLGGASYEPTPVRDPCLPREWRSPAGVEATAEQFTLSALDGAACELGVSRERLALALATETARADFIEEHGIRGAELEAAVRAGLVRAIDDAERAGALDPVVAAPLREAARRIPVEAAIALALDAREVFAHGGWSVDRISELLP
jgi:hypothetical protein